MEGRHGRLAGASPDPEADDAAEDAGEAEAEGTDVREADEAEALEADTVIEVVGIDHVQLSMPPGGEDEARQFYGAVLGFQEVAKPPELAGRGGCWFAAEGAAVHLGAEGTFIALAKAHPALLVRDLAAAREALTAAGIAIEDDDSGLPVRRCYIHDPFGNRIELVDSSDAGFSRM